MPAGAKVFTGICWVLVPLIAAVSCRSGGSALGDAGDVSLPPDGTDGALVADGTDDQLLPDVWSDSELPDGPVAEKRCDVSGGVHTVDQLAKYADCTVLVGIFQEDSVRGLVDLAALQNVRRVEGNINIFRSPGFVTLHGLENLEEVEGNLYIHLNDNLTSIAALGKLRTVTGTLYVYGNPQLPQAEVDIIGARITVGGMKTLGPQGLAQ